MVSDACIFYTTTHIASSDTGLLCLSRTFSPDRPYVNRDMKMRRQPELTLAEVTTTKRKVFTHLLLVKQLIFNDLFLLKATQPKQQ